MKHLVQQTSYNDKLVLQHSNTVVGHGKRVGETKESS
jgi:NOL1/NOP2/fmu family ribosome biogenesis protein